MNIALIRPPKISGAFEKMLIQEPINLAYLAAYLKNQGFSVSILDFEVEPYEAKRLKKKIIEEKIHLVGITSLTPTIKQAQNIASTLKKIKPDLITVAGGPHVSALPEESLREFPDFDFIVIGEGEIHLAQLCEKIKERKTPKNIPGVVCRKGENSIGTRSISYIEDLDKLPFPSRILFKKKLYNQIYAAGIDLKKKSTALFSSRGCPHNCTFCAVKETLGKKVRFRSPENVLAEAEECVRSFGYNHITFEDTNLTLNRERFLKICSGLKKINVSWDCQTRVDLVDKNLLKVMAACGCLKIAYGVESGSQKILDLMKKNITMAQIKNAFYWTRKENIVLCAFFILGSHPEETKEDILKTERLLHKIKPDVFQLSLLCPFPGTEIYSIMKKENMLKEIAWSKLNFMHAYPNWGTKYIKAKSLILLQKKIYLGYLLSCNFLFLLLKKMSNPQKFLYLSKLGFSMLNYLLFEKRPK